LPKSGNTGCQQAWQLPLRRFSSATIALTGSEWIARTIETAGYKPVIQAWDLRPGENFVLRMHEVAAEANITIAVLLEAYLKSEYTQAEWAAAFAKDPTGKKRRLIPVRVAECSLMGMLSQIIHIDLVNLGEQDAQRVLIDGLKPTVKPVGPIRFPGQLKGCGADYLMAFLKKLIRFPGKPIGPGVSTVPFPPDLGRLHGVPDLPPHYLPRAEHIDGLKRKLLAGKGNVGITGGSSVVGVYGMGGIGKTVLAAALARDSEVRRAFFDGIYRLTIGQKPNLLDLQNQLLRRLTSSRKALTTEREAKDALREVLEGRSSLLIVDDAWTIDHSDAFSVTAPPACLIITTRNREVIVGIGAGEHRLDVFSPSDALRILADWVGEKSLDKLSPEACEVAKECGYLPLALAMIGAMVRLSSRPTAWKDALTRLQRADLIGIKTAFPGYPYPDLLRAIQVSIDALDPIDQERYLDLAVFPEDQSIPEGPSHTQGMVLSLVGSRKLSRVRIPH
jgi:hypothetical protein